MPRNSCPLQGNQPEKARIAGLLLSSGGAGLVECIDLSGIVLAFDSVKLP